MGLEHGVRLDLPALADRSHEWQSAKRSHPVVRAFVPADGLQPVGHGLGALDEYRPAVSVGRLILGVSEVGEPRRLEPRALERAKGRLDQETGLIGE